MNPMNQVEEDPVGNIEEFTTLLMMNLEGKEAITGEGGMIVREEGQQT